MAPDQEWLEHETVLGRKFYENTATHEIRWKPPRKRDKQSIRYSFPSTINNNVGTILSKGDLHIANVYSKKKKKYAEAVGYLTNTHFLYTKKRNPNDFYRKIPLFDAHIQRDGVKNVYILQNTFHTIRLKSNEPEIAEVWYHDIRNVIERLSSEAVKRSQSVPGNFVSNDEPHRLSIIYEEIDQKYPTPPGWMVKFDPVRGQYVYFNDTSYSEPWSVESLPDGKIFFRNTKTNEKSWLLPAQHKETVV